MKKRMILLIIFFLTLMGRFVFAENELKLESINANTSKTSSSNKLLLKSIETNLTSEKLPNRVSMHKVLLNISKYLDDNQLLFKDIVTNGSKISTVSRLEFEDITTNAYSLQAPVCLEFEDITTNRYSAKNPVRFEFEDIVINATKKMPPKPNLVVFNQDIKFSTDNPAENQLVSVNFLVYNLGIAYTEGIAKVRVYVDLDLNPAAAPIQEFDLNPLGAFLNSNFSFNYTYTSRADGLPHLFQVNVDLPQPGVVEEWVELDDNSASVLYPKPEDLTGFITVKGQLDKKKYTPNSNIMTFAHAFYTDYANLQPVNNGIVTIKVFDANTNNVVYSVAGQIPNNIELLTDYLGNVDWTFNAPSNIGKYILKIEVSDGTSVGYWESTFEVINLPDLSIEESDIILSNASPDVYERINISAKIYNRGADYDRNISVRFYDNFRFVSEINLAPIPAGNFSVVNLNNFIVPEPDGTYHKLTVKVDLPDYGEPLVEEITKNNNTATIVYPVGDLNIDKNLITVECSTPSPKKLGEQFTVSGRAYYNIPSNPAAGDIVTIKIIGPLHTTNNEIYNITGNNYLHTDILHTDVNGHFSYSYFYALPEPGLYRVDVRIDKQNGVYGTNYCYYIIGDGRSFYDLELTSSYINLENCERINSRDFAIWENDNFIPVVNVKNVGNQSVDITGVAERIILKNSGGATLSTEEIQLSGNLAANDLITRRYSSRNLSEGIYEIQAAVNTPNPLLLGEYTYNNNADWVRLTVKKRKPDLVPVRVSSQAVTNTQPSIKVDVEIKNTGNKSSVADGVLFGLLPDRTNYTTSANPVDLAALSPSASTIMSFDWQPQSGDAELKFTVDCNNGNNDEFIESNNVICVKNCDLTVTNINPDGKRLTAAPYSNAITYYVRNLGDLPTGAHTDRIKITGSDGSVAADFLKSYPATIGFERSFTYTFDNAGEYTIDIWTDNNNEIPEAVEINNHLSIAVLVRAPLPDLYVSDIVPLEQIVRSVNNDIKVIIKNDQYALLAAANPQVQLKLIRSSGESMLGVLTYNGTIAPNATAEIIFTDVEGNWLPSNGDLQLTAVVNPGHLIQEMDYSNNTYNKRNVDLIAREIHFNGDCGINDDMAITDFNVIIGNNGNFFNFLPYSIKCQFDNEAAVINIDNINYTGWINILNGSSKQFTAGQHILKVWVDYSDDLTKNDRVPEANENNNYREFIFNVAHNLPDLSISFNRNSPVVKNGATTAMNYTITNELSTSTRASYKVRQTLYFVCV